MAKVNPNSPYLGIRGGYKGGGRPRGIDECGLRNVSVRLPQPMYDYLRTRDVPATVYLRSLIENDMNNNHYSPSASRSSAEE